MSNTKKDRIRFSDGREGYQIRYLNEEGEWVLHEVVVTKTRDGRKCFFVYAAKSDYSANVFGFGDLGNVEWEIIEEK